MVYSDGQTHKKTGMQASRQWCVAMDRHTTKQASNIRQRLTMLLVSIVVVECTSSIVIVLFRLDAKLSGDGRDFFICQNKDKH
jgi:predicted metal-dependent hydrolase